MQKVEYILEPLVTWVIEAADSHYVPKEYFLEMIWLKNKTHASRREKTRLSLQPCTCKAQTDTD